MDYSVEEDLEITSGSISNLWEKKITKPKQHQTKFINV